MEGSGKAGTDGRNTIVLVELVSDSWDPWEMLAGPELCRALDAGWLSARQEGHFHSKAIGTSQFCHL